MPFIQGKELEFNQEISKLTSLDFDIGLDSIYFIKITARANSRWQNLKQKGRHSIENYAESDGLVWKNSNGFVYGGIAVEL